jgi:hypothetical protein
MIKKNDESGEEKRKVSSFKKFSEMSGDKKSKDAIENPASDILPDAEDRPGMPNLPYKKEKVQKGTSTEYMMPNGINTNTKKGGYTGVGSDNELSNEDVKFYGKVAKLPKGINASKGYNFLENVKVSKSSIWYIMVERQSDELQMVKYNYKKGVDLSKFVGDLKEYYKNKYSKNQKIKSLIENIQVDGNDKYSWVKNIPLVEIDGRKMISIITEDLIKLLSK